MPPIPVRIDDPITPAKPQGTTPQTSQQQHGEALPPTNTTTTAQPVAPAYPPARPGAAAVPISTPYASRPQPEPTRTQVPAAPQNVSPHPQPGAVPIPPSQQGPTTAASTLPPPPKAGESLQQRQASMPSQMQVSPPEQNHAAFRSTASYSTSKQAGGPTTVNLGPVAHEPLSGHAPGYQQNAFAQEMSPAQRSSLEQQERKESVMGSLGGDSASEAAGNMWNTVKGWASVAGEKLAETEENMWKRINAR